MKNENDKRFYFLVNVFIFVGLLGFILLLMNNMNSNNWSLTSFSVVAFLVSIAALIMTTLQSISISRQMRITQKAAQLVRETSRELEILVDEDRKMERELRQDIALDRRIIAALEEHGLGSNEKERKAVAESIQRNFKK